MAIGWPLPVCYTSNHAFDHPVTTFLFAVNACNLEEHNSCVAREKMHVMVMGGGKICGMVKNLRDELKFAGSATGTYLMKTIMSTQTLKISISWLH